MQQFLELIVSLDLRVRGLVIDKDDMQNIRKINPRGIQAHPNLIAFVKVLNCPGRRGI